VGAFESRWLGFTPGDVKSLRTPKRAPDKTDESSETTSAEAPALDADTLPRLPWQLERLVRAASSDLLPEGSTMLASGLVTDLNRYTLAWAASYLTGDRDEALSRLWQARRVWQSETPS
jgi:hypothetical protein